MARFVRLASLTLLVALATAVTAAEAVDGGGKHIALIGGAKSHGAGEHDFANGLALLKRSLETASNLSGIVVDAYPDAWPEDSARLASASTVVWYFDGIQQVPHPLLDGERRKAFAALMAKGVGLVCLHQASSLPADNTSIPLPEWLGGCRYGMVDRANLPTPFTQEDGDSPVCRGWTSFSYKDEVYPTVTLVQDQRLKPILSALLPPEKPARHVIAWTFERSGGGRSFAFTGGHYHQSWAVAEVRRMVLNAVLWTAKIDVPSGGVISTVAATK